MSTDLSIDSCNALDDDAYGSEAFEWTPTITIWNGREIYSIRTETKYEQAIKIIHSEQLQKTISLKERLIELLTDDDLVDEISTLEDVLEKSGYEFDGTLENPQDCKSFIAHLKRIGKEV